MGGPGTGGAKEDPKKLVPNEERETREHGLYPCVTVHPEKRHHWNRQQEGGDSQQRLIGRRDPHGIDIALDVIHLNLRGKNLRLVSDARALSNRRLQTLSRSPLQES